MERDNTGWNGDKGRIFYKRDRCTGYAEKHTSNPHKHIENRVTANIANACEYGYTDFATHRAACNRNSASIGRTDRGGNNGTCNADSGNIASDCTTHIGFTAFGFTGRTKCTARAYSAYQCSSAFADTDSTGGVACYHSAYTNNSAFADADYTGGFACTHSAYTDDFTVGNADSGRNFTDIYKSA